LEAKLERVGSYKQAEQMVKSWDHNSSLTKWKVHLDRLKVWFKDDIKKKAVDPRYNPSVDELPLIDEIFEDELKEPR
jgi:hypothetical protein